MLHKAIYNSYYKQNIYRSIKLARLIEATITVKTLSIEQKKKIIDSYHSSNASSFISDQAIYPIKLVENKNLANHSNQAKQEGLFYYDSVDHNKLYDLFYNQPAFYKTISIYGGEGKWINFKYYRAFHNHLLNLTIIMLIVSLGLEILVLVVFYLYVQENKNFISPLKKIKQKIDHMHFKKIEEIPVPDKGSSIVQDAIKSMRELQERNHSMSKERDIIFANLSHQINTPLTKIKLLISQKASLNSEINSKVTANIQNISDLLSEMMNLAKFNYQEYKENKIELVSFIESIVSEYEDLGLNIQLLNNIKRIHILANTYLLNTAFTNLINNAIKYGKQAVISMNLIQEKVIINIDDYGEGLDNYDINKIFQPFFRAAKHSNISGHGLGLSMAKSIIEKHKGSIKCTPYNEYGGLRMQILLQRFDTEYN
ncbi:MAG: HAMP domain-containing histidine kinase [Legionellales bacterium]|nr:HAMP domain-containing histidine kinase [Legionellales bacterium]